MIRYLHITAHEAEEAVLHETMRKAWHGSTMVEQWHVLASPAGSSYCRVTVCTTLEPEQVVDMLRDAGMSSVIVRHLSTAEIEDTFR